MEQKKNLVTGGNVNTGGAQHKFGWAYFNFTNQEHAARLTRYIAYAKSQGVTMTGHYYTTRKGYVEAMNINFTGPERVSLNLESSINNLFKQLWPNYLTDQDRKDAEKKKVAKAASDKAATAAAETAQAQAEKKERKAAKRAYELEKLALQLKLAQATGVNPPVEQLRQLQTENPVVGQPTA